MASQLFRGKTIHISIHTPKESHFGWSLCIQFGRDTSLRNFENHDDSPSTSKYLETWGNFAHSFGTYIVYRKITHEMMETDLPTFSIQLRQLSRMESGVSESQLARGNTAESLNRGGTLESLLENVSPEPEIYIMGCGT